MKVGLSDKGRSRVHSKWWVIETEMVVGVSLDDLDDLNVVGGRKMPSPDGIFLSITPSVSPWWGVKPLPALGGPQLAKHSGGLGLASLRCWSVLDVWSESRSVPAACWSVCLSLRGHLDFLHPARLCVFLSLILHVRVDLPASLCLASCLSRLCIIYMPRVSSGQSRFSPQQPLSCHGGAGCLSVWLPPFCWVFLLCAACCTSGPPICFIASLSHQNKKVQREKFQHHQ